jgi:nucleoside-diphosphate-sugar epimerase
MPHLGGSLPDFGLLPATSPLNGATPPVWPTLAESRQGRVLVVGAAGYIGSILVRRLLDAGYEVVGLDALLYGDSSLDAVMRRPGFQLRVGDTRNGDLLAGLLASVGSVVHLGEIVGDPACDLDPEVTLAINHEATAGLARLAAQAGVERFIYASSCSVYGATEAIVDETADLNPVSLYAQLKIAGERAILDLASPTFHPVVFRLATVYGLSPRPRFDLVVNVLAGRAAVDHRIAIQGGGQWRPFIHVADVAATFAEAVRLPAAAVAGEVFNLGSNDQNLTIRGVANIVRDCLPDTIVEEAPIEDRRNYRVSFDKITGLGFRSTRTVLDGVREIIAAVSDGRIADITDPRHSNVRALVETSARLKVWRSELDGQPTAPFRPRDIEQRSPAARATSANPTASTTVAR